MMVNVERLGVTDPRNIIAANLGDSFMPSSVACVCVGDEIEELDDNTLRGHGTQIMHENLVASVCGVVDRVNKLVTVRTLHRRYVAEVGDVVVGRVTEVVSKRWRIDLLSRQEAQLMLSAVSLMGGVQRRRTQEDELNMRSVFKEGDLVSAEVQAIQHDGTVMLHTRSTKYGRLSRGRGIRVPAELVKRQRNHFQHLKQSGVDIILGCNGMIWVSYHVEQEGLGARMEDEGNEDREAVMFSELSEPTQHEREAVARASQATLALAKLGYNIRGESIAKVVELSLQEGVKASDMLEAGFLTSVAAQEGF